MEQEMDVMDWILKTYWNDDRQFAEKLVPAKVPTRATYRTGNVYYGTPLTILKYGRKIYARVEGRGEFQFIFPSNK